MYEEYAEYAEEIYNDDDISDILADIVMCED